MMDLVHNKERLDAFRARAKELIGQMTLEEKVYQTLYNAPAIERLGIASYNWWNEALHGVARAGTATVFPQAIGLAATFDEDFMEEIGDAVSTEARAKFNMQQEFGDHDIYKGLTFWAPNINIFRDPRWGRGHETLGEDPYLTSRMGVRYIEGLQGHDEKYLKTAACAKHFAVHSGPEGLRHHFNAEVSKKDLFETYLPAFKACVQEGKVEAVMGAYNRTNGEPCCGSKTLLKDILRDEWGFEGHVTSDCWAIKDFYEGHKVTKDAEESVALAMNNGCDLNCGTLFVYLLDAIRDGLVKEERLDEALVNLFTTRMKLGVFDKAEDNPYNQIPYSVVDSEPMQQLNLTAAKRCLTLLKNGAKKGQALLKESKILPLDKEKIHTIGVIGPNADNRRALVGNYEGTASRYVTVLEGIEDYAKEHPKANGEKMRVMYSEGCHLYKDRTSNLADRQDRLAEVKGVCKESDVVVVCLGLDAGLEGEEGDAGNEFSSGDKLDLRFPGLQNEVLEAACESGKPVILLVLAGSAMDLSWADEHVDAILQCWYPGAQGGNAIAQILFGDACPQGRLPITLYRTTEELPEFTNYSMEGRTYRYMKNKPLYPFGYGLSYTEFAISNIALSTQEITPDGIDITAEVTNIGEMDGTQTIQVYVKADREGTPNAQLKGIAKAALKKGETQTVQIHLDEEAFGLCDEDGVKQVLPGTYHIFIGAQQPDERSTELTGEVCSSVVVRVPGTIKEK